MKDIYIIGCGGFGREVSWLIERINFIKKTWNIKGFIDDNKDFHDSYFGDYKVLGGLDYLENILLDEIWVICTIASTKSRSYIIDKISKKNNIKFATLVDPSVIISNSVNIGEGSVICAYSVITVDIKLGKHVIINLHSTVGHDAIIKDFVTIHPNVNISGNVEIGENTEIGTGTQIIQGKKIGQNIIIGAGSVVTNDIIASGIYVGVPAKIINHK